MAIANNFPYFEADQVLTNTHLNNLFDYLDQQNRLTRIKLIGSGIVCGLEISYSPEGIHISKGAALTSQGFMAMLCENDYTHFIPYACPPYPKDIQLISQCSDIKPENIPFYKPAFDNNNLSQLITANAFDALDADVKQKAVALSTLASDGLDKYAVVLFLETEELNLKNCDTNDCNDKGSRMDFDVKVLLIEKVILDRIKNLPQGESTGTDIVKLPEYLKMKRYNVPVNNIHSADEVLSAFAVLVDDATLKRVAVALNACYSNYKYLLKDELDNPFTDLYNDLQRIRGKIIANDPILLQYFYDFIDDLVKAYHEFRHYMVDMESECCGNEMKFPFHIMLGEANESTNIYQHSLYRQYFIYSPLFDSQKEKLDRTRSLFTRMKLMVEEFSWTDITGFEKLQVKITPSRYGNALLSKRCIPYYYKVAETGKELFPVWDFDKTKKGRSKFNLSYNAAAYATADPVKNPLLYDIEAYDFYRIEGHIGKDINNALVKVKSLQQEFNLPFDTIALSADYIGALVKGEEPHCIIQDLESDYRVLIAEFVCRLHDGLCLASKVAYTGKRTFLSVLLANAAMNTSLAAGASIATTSTTAAADDEDEDKLILNAINRLPEGADHIFVSTLVNEFQAIKKYQKGDTLSRLCNPDPKKSLIGSTYISIIKRNKGVFKNPVAFHALVPISPLSYQLFEFIDSIESLFKILMTSELGELNIGEFKIAFKTLEDQARNLNRTYQTIRNEVQMTFDSCIVERLEALKNEYLKRIAQYRLAKNFNYYFKKHGGIEHKAGVPRGGTFILVYHEERRKRFIDVRSMFINKELSAVMMSHFQTLLKPEVKLNHLEFQANLVQTAALYKDPELYLRFKDVMQKYLEECNDLPDDRRKAITEILTRPPERSHFELKNEMVIADFYIPYLCCSDCPPITYILAAPEKDTSADPTIKIDKTSFCNDDKASFIIKVTPPNGELTGDGISTGADGGFTFSPLNLGEGLHNITYTANGKSVTAIVQVTAAPKPKFSYRAEVDNQVMHVFFTNESEGINDQTTYEWLLNGVKFSEKKSPDPIQFDMQPIDRIVLLRETNGGCPAEFKDIIKQPIVEEKRLAVCNRVKSQKLESSIPEGAVITIIKNDGNITDNSLVIHPSLMNITKTTIFEVIYTVNDRKVHVSITVIFTNADFTMELTHNNTATALLPTMLTLRSLGEGLSGSTWEIKQGDNAITNITEGIPFPLRLAPQSNPNQPVVIIHTAETSVENTVCKVASKPFTITAAIAERHLNKQPPFDNNTLL